MNTPDKLDTKQIAEFLSCSREHVTDKVTKRPDFPRPFINTSRRIRFWLRSEVEAWARGQSRSAMSSEDAR